MTLYDFNALTLEEKQAITWKQGVFLDNYITEDIRIGCYAIDKFFVEVVYDAKQNVITEVLKQDIVLTSIQQSFK